MAVDRVTAHHEEVGVVDVQGGARRELEDALPEDGVGYEHPSVYQVPELVPLEVTPGADLHVHRGGKGGRQLEGVLQSMAGQRKRITGSPGARAER